MDVSYVDCALFTTFCGSTNPLTVTLLCFLFISTFLTPTKEFTSAQF